MKVCTLCFDHEPISGIEVWNEPLYATPNFFVVPSLGALVEGWVLIVPREHCISFGALPDALHEEFFDVKETVAAELESRYGALCVFEHGPSQSHQKVGCTVDHAHLHMLPFADDLPMMARSLLPPNAIWRRGNLRDCQNAFQSRQDYLYVEKRGEEGHVILHPHFESQIFRRAIATHLNMPDQFDWRSNPQIENVLRTIRQCQFEGIATSA